MTRFFLLAVGMILMAGCTLSDQPTEDGVAAYEPRPMDFVKLSRTACFGTCPVYDITLFGDGRLLFHGARYTKTSGQKQRRSSTSEFLSVLRELEQRGFWELGDTYDRSSCTIWATDHPSVIVEVRTAAQSKTLTWYQGCRGIKERSKLQMLTDELDRLLGSEQFVGSDEERKTLSRKPDR